MGQHNWPQWSSSFIKPGFPESSLLAGTEPAIWEALGRLDLNDFRKGKQVVLRQALEDIGLGWVATNTTPFRRVVGGLFDAAEKCRRSNEQKAGTRGPVVKSTGNTAPKIQVETHTLPEAREPIAGPINDSVATETNRRALWDHLVRYGACVVRNAVSSSNLNPMPDAQQGKATKLARTMGNGVAGDPPGVYVGFTETPQWHHSLEQSLGRWLVGPGAPGACSDASTDLNRKSILLFAGAGAENWAHQDNNDEVPPVQALLMLSRPHRDFAGGEFYVARQTENTASRITVVRYEVAFESPGDLVIFMAGKNTGWWHGMLSVTPGTSRKPGNEYLRKAVGMLQPSA